jgi:hypothetical protein
MEIRLLRLWPVAGFVSSRAVPVSYLIPWGAASCGLLKNFPTFYGTPKLGESLLARPQVTDAGDGLQLWRVAENVLNKQTRGGPSALWMGVGLRNLTVKNNFVKNVRKGVAELSQFVTVIIISHCVAVLRKYNGRSPWNYSIQPSCSLPPEAL